MHKTFSIEHIPKNHTFKVHIFHCYFRNYDAIMEVYDWCKDNIQASWSKDENILIFGIFSPYFADIFINKDEDAMLFKLTWC